MVLPVCHMKHLWSVTSVNHGNITTLHGAVDVRRMLNGVKWRQEVKGISYDRAQEL